MEFLNIIGGFLVGVGVTIAAVKWLFSRDPALDRYRQELIQRVKRSKD